VLETLRALRTRGIHVGSTTGYTRAMMDVLEPVAGGAGLVADALVCADEVPQYGQHRLPVSDSPNGMGSIRCLAA
jgi:beta-phosphoglucomutase-like phosphatase (HAD superfamily)